MQKNNLRTLALLLLLVVVSSFLVACGPTTEEEITAEVVVSEGARIHFDGPEAQANVKAAAVYDVFIEEDAFFPGTLTVPAGEPVQLVFAFDEQHYISIENLLAEDVQYETIDLTFAQGEYLLVCEDCDGVEPALIVAQ